jgi:inorganic pyrophosphatase
MNLAHLATWDSQLCNVVIETVKGERNKFKYDPESGTFMLCKVLPCGMVFPYDFGFIPSTVGDDGDPLDVLVLMDAPCFPGCRIQCRLIGVLEARQTEDGKRERNDRLLAVAEQSHDHKDVHSIKDLNKHFLKEMEHFFVSYNEMEGKKFVPLSWYGPKRAKKLAEKGLQKAGKARKPAASAKQPSKNGQAKGKKGRRAGSAPRARRHA